MTEQPLQTPLEESGVPDVWRDEVQARLERYKRRRGRRIEGAFTMRFPFPPEEATQAAVEQEDAAQENEQFNSAVTSDTGATDTIEVSPIAVDVAKEASEETPQAEHPQLSAGVTSAPPAIEPEPEEESPRLVELRPRPLPRRKVIAFPSPSYAQTEAGRRIADPVQPEQLRILDVPEELQAMPATPFLEGLLDASPAWASDVRSDGVKLPSPTLGAARRIGAASIDAVVTLAGVCIFAAGGARFLPALPPSKFLVAGLMAVSVLLWASYQYLFIVYRGRTVGMTATHVRLQTFKGCSPDFRRRQSRVLGLYISVLSLGMGVLWYFVDVESLCWHDRISQTFPVAADKS